MTVLLSCIAVVGVVWLLGRIFGDDVIVPVMGGTTLLVLGGIAWAVAEDLGSAHVVTWLVFAAVFVVWIVVLRWGRDWYTGWKVRRDFKRQGHNKEGGSRG